MTKKLFLLFSVLIATLALTAQPKADINELDNVFAKTYDDFKMSGLSIGIIKDGETVFSKGYGYLEYGKDRKVDDQTIFEIASCTKAFTACAIGILVDEGKLNWDDRVIDHLPGFQLYDPYVTRELRIIDLLCHRTGFNTFDGDLLWYGTNYSRKEVVERIRYMPLKNSLRMKYGYSNVMFITAGEVIESVTGKTWDEFVTERIFKPLGMNSTRTTNTVFTKEANKALPHLDRKPMDFINYDNAGPAASINSNIADLLKWTQMWLNGGTYEGKEIISKKTYETITSSQMALPVRGSQKALGIDFSDYGLGWSLFEYEGKKVITHNGGLPGFLSKVAFVPELNLGIVILYNDMSYILEAAMFTILDSYLKGVPGDHLTKLKDQMNKYADKTEEENDKRTAEKIPDTKPSLGLNEYAGKYTDKMYGEAEIKLTDDRLILTLLPTKELFTAELIHWNYDAFDFAFKDPFLPRGFATFEIDHSGNVTGFKIDLPNPDFHFYNLHFIKKAE